MQRAVASLAYICAAVPIESGHCTLLGIVAYVLGSGVVRPYWSSG